MKGIGSLKVALARTAVLGCVAAVGMLTLAPAAGGQSSADQYIPATDPAGAPGGAAAGSSGNSGDTAGDAPSEATGSGPPARSGTGAGGTLPFTGYPLTPVVDLVLLLLVGSLILRFVVPRIPRREA